MTEKKKKKRKLSAWNIFIRDNSGKKKYTLPSGSPDLKAMSRDYHGGSSKSKSKPKAKPKERIRTTAKKDTPKKRRRGPLERKAGTYYAELYDIARALRIPVSKATIRTGKTATTVTVGRIIRVKRKKLSDAMKEVRKRAKDRI